MSAPVRTLTAVRYLQTIRRARPARTPAELARRLDPTFNVTPAIRLLSDLGARSVIEPDQRDTASTPPRTGKSQTLAVWLTVWGLQRDPDMQIVIVCHSDDLAQEHSRKAREIIKEHADALGYRLAQDKSAVGRWRVEGHKGGMLATGINSGVVGFGADLMVIDDPVKDAAQADSAAHRKRVLNEYQGSLATRVHKGGSVIIVMTRWHEEDLVGSMVEREPGEWRQTNIPAVSDAKVPDALGRRPGVAMISALGFTAADFAKKRRSVGERFWYAQYQGMPNTPEGSLVKADWLDQHRIAIAPPRPSMTVVTVDPADSGEGDECGLVAASRFGERVAMIADRSAKMTSDQWAVAAVKLAVEVGASEIIVEGFTARATYTRMVREALGRAEIGHYIKVSAWPPKGQPKVGDAIARSGALLQALEVGTCVLAGTFLEFENSAVLWQRGQHQPDRLAALVIAHDVLVRGAGLEWDIATPESAADTAAGTASPAQKATLTVMDDWLRFRAS